jgi:ubiquinone/menaquinone biosynthesis C-methylase UbiE
VLQHLDDRVFALRELHRVLRRNGYLVVSTGHPTADWLNHGGSYFTMEPIEEIWQGNWAKRYWRQPLSATCDEFSAAGLIDRLVEPTPDLSMERADPKHYEQLMREPGLVAFPIDQGAARQPCRSHSAASAA